MASAVVAVLSPCPGSARGSRPGSRLGGATGSPKRACPKIDRRLLEDVVVAEVKANECWIITGYWEERHHERRRWIERSARDAK